MISLSQWFITLCLTVLYCLILYKVLISIKGCCRCRDRIVVGFTTTYMQSVIQCLSPLMLWVRISIKARCTTLWDKVCHCQWQVIGFLRCPPPMLKVALNTIQPTKTKHIYKYKENYIQIFVPSLALVSFCLQ